MRHYESWCFGCLSIRRVIHQQLWLSDQAVPGTYELEAQIDDPAGARTIAKWQIRVSEPAEPWREAVRATIADYTGCLNAKDLQCLDRVWIPNDRSLIRAYWKSRIGIAAPIEVAVRIRWIEPP